VLLASFLGLSAGCLAATARWDLLPQVPALLVLTMGAAHVVEKSRPLLEKVLDVGGQSAPSLVFFGTEIHRADLARLPIPMEVLGGLFFALVAATFLGLGQELGRTLSRMPDRVRSYIVNIAGSLAGVVLFTAVSWAGLAPFWWFSAGAAGLGWLLVRKGKPLRLDLAAALVAAPALAALTSWSWVEGGQVLGRHYWSPYYRVDVTNPPFDRLVVNLVSHQTITPLSARVPGYGLIHLLRRDSGGPPFRDVLIIGSGTGNDLSRALAWGAQSVDAVEIDPVIARLGRERNPDRPYADPRVRLIQGDGRNYLRSTEKKYDLIVYALVDSLVLHSSYSSIRLENYLFTREAIADVHRLLKPDGMFAMYNFYRQGWIVARLEKTLREEFGAPPLLFSLPPLDVIPLGSRIGLFSMLVAGATESLSSNFAAHEVYSLDLHTQDLPAAPNGFAAASADSDHWLLRPARVAEPDDLRIPTDDWPFLYLRRPSIPGISARGAAVMAVLSLALLALVGAAKPSFVDRKMFFLGAGFMLLETRSVVQMALLFGSTWVVNAFVFAFVLTMILAANLLVYRLKPKTAVPFAAALFASLLIQALVPLRTFLGWGIPAQAAGAGLVTFAPIFLSAALFSVYFSRSDRPDRALGANILGSMAGGLCEYGSMVWGFSGLLAAAGLFYALALVPFRRAAD
jgi:SAM-dependent methyltransferase